MDGKLLRGDVRDKGFLLKADQGEQLLRVGNEESDQMWRVIRYQDSFKNKFFLFGCTESRLWHSRSLVVAFELLVAACEI